MNIGKPISGESVTIGRDHWDVPVRVELRAYLRFSRRMDGELRRLVACWAHLASPRARGLPAARPQSIVAPSPPTT